MQKIYKALAEFQKIAPDIKKEAENPFFKSKYASLETILPALKEPLEKAGLCFTQIPTGDNELRTIIFHVESGEQIEGTVKILVAKQDPQGQGAGITYMRRYALVSMLGLNTEVDDDGNLASGKKSTDKVISYDEAPF